MASFILPGLALIVGAAAGFGGAVFLAEPPAEITDEETGESDQEDHAASDHEESTESDESELVYAKLANQFVVPVIVDEEMTALVVMSIALGLPDAKRDAVYLAEPRLRDAFLQVLFDHANLGGFSGDFTTIRNMDILRRKLLTAARAYPAGEDVELILITEIGRQDL